MNLRIHSGNVTGDSLQQVMAICKMDSRYGYDETLWQAVVGPLDAPDGINTGRMVAAQDTQFQQQTLRYRP